MATLDVVYGTSALLLVILLSGGTWHTIVFEVCTVARIARPSTVQYADEVREVSRCAERVTFPAIDAARTFGLTLCRAIVGIWTTCVLEGKASGATFVLEGIKTLVSAVSVNALSAMLATFLPNVALTSFCHLANALVPMVSRDKGKTRDRTRASSKAPFAM